MIMRMHVSFLAHTTICKVERALRDALMGTKIGETEIRCALSPPQFMPSWTTNHPLTADKTNFLSPEVVR